MQEHFPAEYLEKLKARHQDQDSGAIEVPATRLDSLWNSFDSLFTINAYRPDETVKSTVPSGISKMYVFVDMNCIDRKEHTSELKSLMRISYAVFCLKKKNQQAKAKHSTTPSSRRKKAITTQKQYNTTQL